MFGSVIVSLAFETKFPVQEYVKLAPPSILYSIVADVNAFIPAFFNVTTGSKLSPHNSATGDAIPWILPSSTVVTAFGSHPSLTIVVPPQDTGSK